LANTITLAVVVLNHTNEEMILEERDLESGKWIDRPESIPSGEESDFITGGGQCGGIAGLVRWRSERTGSEFTISFNKPVRGTTRFSVNTSDQYRYTISGDPLDRHALVRVSFYRQGLELPELPVLPELTELDIPGF
jgi:hypothetical protein